MDEGRAVCIVYLNFNRDFDTASHNVLIGKIRKGGLDKWTAKWIENWLNGTCQRDKISRRGSSWRPVTSSVCQGVRECIASNPAPDELHLY